MANQGLVPDDIAARYEVHEWRKWACNSERSTPGRMAKHPGSAAGLCAVEKRHTQAWWIEGIDRPQAGHAFRKTWLDRESVRYAYCGGQIGIRRSDAQGGLLQEPRGARSRVEQQGPILRPTPEKFSSVVRSAGNRRWRNHDPMHRTAADFQSAGKGAKLW